MHVVDGYVCFCMSRDIRWSKVRPGHEDAHRWASSAQVDGEWPYVRAGRSGRVASPRGKWIIARMSCLEPRWLHMGTFGVVQSLGRFRKWLRISSVSLSFYVYRQSFILVCHFCILFPILLPSGSIIL